MGKSFNRTGRSNKKERFVALPHSLMDSFAWRRLSVTARATWLEFVRVHNGHNNGKIAMPEITLGERLGMSHDTAARAIKELLTFGFIEKTKAASFIGKRRAAEYLLTHIPDDRTDPKGLPSRTFQNIGKIAPNSGNGLASNKQPSISSTISRLRPSTCAQLDVHQDLYARCLAAFASCAFICSCMAEMEVQARGWPTLACSPQARDSLVRFVLAPLGRPAPYLTPPIFATA